MSQEILLKPQMVSAGTQPEQSAAIDKVPATDIADERSFSAELETQVEQLPQQATTDQEEATKTELPQQATTDKEEATKTELPQQATTDKEEATKTDDATISNEGEESVADSGNNLPEEDVAQHLIVDQKTVDLDSEIAQQSLPESSVIRLTAAKNNPVTQQQPIEKLVPKENKVLINAVKPKAIVANNSQATLSKPAGKAVNSNSIVTGLTATVASDTELAIEQKVSTNLRSDIFHALAKKQLAELASAADKKGTLQPLSGRGESSTVTAATTLGSSTATSASSAVSQPVLAIQPAIHSDSWNRVLNSRVAWMAREGIQQAEIKLNPASLGQVEVKVSLNNEQATVNFIAQHAATRDALEQALPKLRESLGQQGLQLADADVSEQAFSESDDDHQDDIGHGGEQLSEADNNDQQVTETGDDLELGLSIYA